MLKITGYSDRLYVRPSETIKFMVSCDGIKTYRADIVRLVCGDASPKGPGFKEQVVRTPVSRRYKGRKQPIYAGSYVHVPDGSAFDGLESFTVQAVIWPTTPKKGVQGIVSKWSERKRSGFALILDETGAVALRLGDDDGRVETVSTGKTLMNRHWYFVGASFDAKSRKVCIVQNPLVEFPDLADRTIVARKSKLARIGNSDAPLLMAAIFRQESKGKILATGHYNGKIARPRLTSRALNESEMVALNGMPTSTDDTTLIGAWDFSTEMASDKITDLSLNKIHGMAMNLPTRAMTGPNWTGEKFDWKSAPEQWDAIHFHDDDLYDADWAVDFELKIPGKLKSGLYAARLRSGKEEEYIPFAVGPRPGKEAKIALLLSTATYLAYANEHMAIDGDHLELQCGRLMVLHAHEIFLGKHREYGGSLYDLHSDGSGFCYSSWLRPILNMRPKCDSVLGGFGDSCLWGFNADTHITDWLEAMGQTYDVITDDELHRSGIELLKPYRALITGTHPEYWSTEMLDALDGYKSRGGRLMYMGGDGFYWRAAFHPEKAGVIEVRRNENGIRPWASRPGEYYHSFNGEYGGLWSSQGRPPHSVVGTGFCAWAHDLCSYYRRKPGSFDPKVRFIFEGIGKDEAIGNFGLLGGGASGLEIDRASHDLGTPPNALLLASSENHTDSYLPPPDECLEILPGLGGQENPDVRADMLFFKTPNGGAVFSTSSIAWAGSLSHSSYDNNVSRITANVLRRFLDPTPI